MSCTNNGKIDGLDDSIEPSMPTMNDNSEGSHICIRHSVLYKSMRPMLLIMKVFGLYHYKQFVRVHRSPKDIRSDEVNNYEESTAYKRYHITPSMIYSGFVCALLFVNSVRTLFIFRLNDGESFELSQFLFKIMLVSWVWNCTFNSFACFRASQLWNGLTQFFLEFGKCAKTSQESMCKRKFVMCNVVCMVLIILNVVAYSALLFWTPLLDTVIAPLNPNNKLAFIVKSVSLIVQIYLTCSWIYPSALMYVLADLLCNQFKKFNKTLQLAIESNKNQIPIDMEVHRQKFQKLIRLVGSGDQFLSLYNGMTLGFCAVVLTVNTYNIIWYEEVRDNALALTISVLWTIAAIAQIVMVCHCGARLNSESHGCLGFIYDVRMDMAMNDLSLNMFLSKLNGPPIGLSALGMFVIDKPVILTILGLFATYFIVIVQFSPVFTQSTAASSCNCTLMLQNITRELAPLFCNKSML